jgi:hypothetical protein
MRWQQLAGRRVRVDATLQSAHFSLDMDGL